MLVVLSMHPSTILGIGVLIAAMLIVAVGFIAHVCGKKREAAAPKKRWCPNRECGQAFIWHSVQQSGHVKCPHCKQEFEPAELLLEAPDFTPEAEGGQTVMVDIAGSRARQKEERRVREAGVGDARGAEAGSPPARGRHGTLAMSAADGKESGRFSPPCTVFDMPAQRREGPPPGAGAPPAPRSAPPPAEGDEGVATIMVSGKPGSFGINLWKCQKCEDEVQAGGPPDKCRKCGGTSFAPADV